jgi:hypothetical protein
MKLLSENLREGGAKRRKNSARYSAHMHLLKKLRKAHEGQAQYELIK